METQHQTNHHVDVGGTGKLTPGNSNTANTNTPNSNYLCRQSSTRWTPTTEQIRILKDLYYNSGVRSPNADQIQKISARLRQYGKIEGKNVFYWFQNHKARERQKKRFTTTTSSNGVANMGATGPTNDHQLLVPLHRNGGGSGIWKGGNDGEKYGGSFGAPGASCPSSSSAAVGMVSVGQVVGGFGYGHMSMENQLRDCAISACGNGGICNGYPPPHSGGFQLAGVQQYHSSFPHPSSYSFLDGKNCRFQEDDHHFVEEEQDHAEIETLPLFPMHGDYHQDSTSNIPSSSFYTPMMRPSELEPEPYYTNSCHWVNSSSGSTGAAAARAASLELSLNSYGTHWPNF